MRSAAFGSESSSTASGPSSSSRMAREARRKKHLKRQADTIRDARKDRKSRDEYPTTHETRTKHAGAYTSGGRRRPQETPSSLVTRGIRWFFNCFLPDTRLPDCGSDDAGHAMPGSFPRDDPMDAMDVDSGPISASAASSDTHYEDDVLQPIRLRFSTTHPSALLERELRRARSQKRQERREENKDTRRFYPIDPPSRYSSLAQQGPSKDMETARESMGCSAERTEEPLSDADTKAREEECQRRADEEEHKLNEYTEQLRREIREDEKRGDLYNLDVRLRKLDILIKMSVPNHKSKIAFLWEDPAWCKFSDEVFRARYQRRDSRPSSRLQAGYSGIQKESPPSPSPGTHCSAHLEPKVAKETEEAACHESYEDQQSNVSSPDVEMSDGTTPPSESLNHRDSDVRTASPPTPADGHSPFEGGVREPNAPLREQPGGMAEKTCHKRPSGGCGRRESEPQSRTSFAEAQDGGAKTNQATTNEQTSPGDNVETKLEPGPKPDLKEGRKEESKEEPRPEPQAKVGAEGKDEGAKSNTTETAKAKTRRPRPGMEPWRHTCPVIYDHEKDPWPELCRLREQGQTNTWLFECQWLACKAYLKQKKSNLDSAKRSADRARDLVEQGLFHSSHFVEKARVYFREFHEWLKKVSPREGELRKCEPTTFAFHNLNPDPTPKDRLVAYFEWYEAEWTDISSPGFSDSLTFFSIPWPFVKLPRSVSNVTTSSVKTFMKQCHSKGLLCSSKLQPFDMNKMTTKQKNAVGKRELMRWHPDKFDARVLSRIKNEKQRERVKEAAGVVQRAFTEFMNEPDSDVPAELAGAEAEARSRFRW